MPAAPSLISKSHAARCRARNCFGSLLQATRTAAAVFTVLIGAILFGYFLTVTQVPQKITEFITGLGLSATGALVLIMLMYLVLGCLMDAMAMIILTIPIIFPVIEALGFDPICSSGVIIVMTVELDAYSSACRYECFRHQNGGEGCQLHDHLLWRAAVRGDRHSTPRDPHRLSRDRAILALAHVARRRVNGITRS